MFYSIYMQTIFKWILEEGDSGKCMCMFCVLLCVCFMFLSENLVIFDLD
jgi:hypothetical protein